MTNADSEPFDASDPHQLGCFRYAVAGMIKHLICARSLDDPSFLTEAMQARWWPDGNLPRGYSREHLLTIASQQLKRVLETYGGSLNSLPSPLGDSISSFDALRQLIFSFVNSQILEDAVRQSHLDEEIDWILLADWQTLDEIRNGLDNLPRPSDRPQRRRNNQDLDCETGPFPPNGFRFEGTPARGCRPMSWRLINYLWGQTNRVANIEGLAEPVWRDHEEDITPNKLGSVRRAANSFSRSNGIPFSIKVIQHQVHLEYHEQGAGSPSPEVDDGN